MLHQRKNLFRTAFIIFSCLFFLPFIHSQKTTIGGSTTVHQPLKTATAQDSAHLLQVNHVQFLGKEKTTRSFSTNEPCIVDGTYYDECPINVGQDETGQGGGGGSGNPTQSIPPDFNPLSGSIAVTNPATVGQNFKFSFVIANQGGTLFPTGSLHTLGNLPIEGVIVSFHILRPSDPQISAANEVFRGVFDPTVIDESKDYFISGSFTLSSQMASAGEHDQFAVVVDPDNFVPELNENNNTSFDPDILQIVGDAPDLVPLTGKGNVLISPDPVNKGQTLSLGCRVQNNGASLSGPVSFKIKYTATLDGADELAHPIELATVSRFIGDGSVLVTNDKTGLLQKNITVNLNPGHYKIFATVDPDNLIHETGNNGESNNAACIGSLSVLAGSGPAVKKPDLVFFPFTDGPAVEPLNVTQKNEKLRTRVILSNIGTADVTGEIFIDLNCINLDPPTIPGVKRLNSIKITGLKAGASIIIDLTSFTFSGHHHLIIGSEELQWKVTAPHVDELNTENNKFEIPNAFKLLAPDLTVQSGSVATATLLSSSSGSKETVIKIPVTNLGNLVADDYTCVFVLQDSISGDSVGSVTVTSYPFLFSLDFPVKPSETVMLTAVFSGDFITTGTYKLFCSIDPDNLVDESVVLRISSTGVISSGETNNKTTIPFRH